MSSTVTIDEKQLLYSIQEYLKTTGRLECVVALEDSSEFKSTDLSFLRQLCLCGCWEDVIECIKVFKCSEGYKKCIYEATKQWYLETLSCKAGGRAEEPKVKLLADLLLKLKTLCPSNADYSSLLSLLELPSNSEHATRSQSQSRMTVYHSISAWMVKTLYPELNTGAGDSLNSRLVRLMAKGLMYEQCEQICMSRCGDGHREGSDMLDLSGWMQQQPDSAYQTSPSTCRLCFKGSDTEQTNDQQPTQDCVTDTSDDVVPASVPSTHNLVPEVVNVSTISAPIPKEAFTPDLPNVSSKQSEQVSTEQVTKQVPMKEVPAASVQDALPHGTEPSSTEHKSVEPELPQVVATPIKTSNIQVREADSTDKIRVFEDNFTAYTPLTNQGLPSLKTGRDSSTPKPSSNKLHPSPPTSPVGTPQRPAGDSPNERGLLREELPRRRFDFNDTTTEEVSIEWPTSTLLSQVQDTQAVRSVAFSQSGSVVAVGANSKTLRLCSTASLLEGKVSNELQPFYHHSSYHKGSIYCLAWSGDSMLASGSNDHKIRLLSYDPSRSDNPCKTAGELNIHTGTIRDLVFTPVGLLVSGGAVDTAVKVSDCATRQLVCSLAGHSEQVLTVDALDDNVLVSGSQDKTVKLWDLRQRDPIWTITCDHPVNSLSVCPSRNELVSSHSDGSCKVHNMTTSSTRATYHPHSDDCRSVKWSPSNGQWILSGSYDGTVCVAEPGSLEWQQIGEHSDKVVQVRWHPEGNVYATTGADKKACFWALN